MGKWEDIVISYNKNIESLKKIRSESWQELKLKELRNHCVKLQDIIKNLNSDKRDFLRYNITSTSTEDKKNTSDYFTACDNWIQTTKTDILEPVTDLISEKRDKLLYKRGLFYGVILGLILSSIFQFLYDSYKTKKAFEQEQNQKIEIIQGVDSLIKQNNSYILDSINSRLNQNDIKIKKSSKDLKNIESKKILSNKDIHIGKSH